VRTLKAISLMMLTCLTLTYAQAQTRTGRLGRPESDMAVRSAQQPASAQSPMTSKMIRYTGSIWSDSPTAVTGVISVTFNVYSDATTEIPIWSETQNVEVSNGGFIVLLGETTDGLPSEVFAAGEARWIGCTALGMYTESRQMLLAVPYAMKAVEAETLGGHASSEFVTGAQLNAAVDAAIANLSTSPTTFSAPSVLSVEAGGTGSSVQNFVDLTSNQQVAGQKTFSGAISIMASSAKPFSIGPVGAPIFEIDANGMVSANTAQGTAVAGFQNDSGMGQGIGVMGYAASEQGIGVYGWSNSDLGRNSAGVYGQASGTEATGVWGWSANSAGTTRGVAGEVFSADGVAGWFDNHAAGKVARFSVDGVEVASVEGDGTVKASVVKLAIGGAVVLQSPNGQACARLGLNDDGTLSLISVTCQ
jgi:trimeric autotransporter adhesin